MAPARAGRSRWLRRAAWRAMRSSSGGLVKRRHQASELRALPLLEAIRGGGERLGDGRDRDAARPRELVDALHVWGRVLAVVNPHLDRPRFCLAVDGLLVL